MTTITTSDSNIAEKFNKNGGVDITIGSIGGLATITTSSSFNLGTIFGTENIPYNIVVNTDAAINITLPTSPQIIRGWKVRIILISAANTGSIRILRQPAVAIGFISSVYNTPSVEIKFTNVSVASQFRITYFVGNSNSNTQRIINFGINSNNPVVPVLSPLSYMRFFSYSGTSGSASINANVTTLATIPWEVGTPGRFVDTRYFNTSINNRIQLSVQGNYRIEACIYVNAAGGATPINIARMLFDGTVIANAQVSLGTISNTSTQVIYITLPSTSIVNLPVTNFVVLSIGKTAISAGTNIVDRVNSYIFAEYISTQ